MARQRPSTFNVSRPFGWGLVTLSIALHGVLLRLPMPPLGELKVPEPDIEPPTPVSVTRLPEVASPAAELPVEPPKPAEPALPEPTTPELAVPDPIAQPFDAVVIPPDPPEPDPPDPDPPEPDPPDPDPLPALEGGAVVPFADDFPHLADAQMGCYGLSSCGSLPNIGNYRAAARQLLPALESQGYQIDEHSTDEPGYLIYRLSNPDWRNGEPYYLSIFPDGLGQAVYVITHEVITLEGLKQLV